MLTALSIFAITRLVYDDGPLVRNGGFEIAALPRPHTPLPGHPLPESAPAPLGWILNGSSWGAEPNVAVEGTHCVSLWSNGESTKTASISQELRALPRGTRFEVHFKVLNQNSTARGMTVTLDKYNLAARQVKVQVSLPNAKAPTAWTECKVAIEWDSLAFPTPKLTLAADPADHLLLDDVKLVRVD